MTVRWAESRPYITEVLPHYFAVRETQWNRNVATQCTSSLLPTYQDPPDADPFPDMRLAREGRAAIMPHPLIMSPPDDDSGETLPRPPRTSPPAPAAAAAAASTHHRQPPLQQPLPPHSPVDEPPPTVGERPKTPRPYAGVCQIAAEVGKLQFLQGDGLPKTFAHILDNRHLRGLVSHPTYTCSRCGVYSRMHTHLDFSLVGDLNA